MDQLHVGRPWGTHVTVYLISCALRDVKHDYANFWHTLEKAGAKRAMESVWLIESSAKLDDLTRSVLRFLTPEDRLLVAEIGKWSATHLVDETAEWLKAHKP